MLTIPGFKLCFSCDFRYYRGSTLSGRIYCSDGVTTWEIAVSYLLDSKALCMGSYTHLTHITVYGSLYFIVLTLQSGVFSGIVFISNGQYTSFSFNSNNLRSLFFVIAAKQCIVQIFHFVWFWNRRVGTTWSLQFFTYAAKFQSRLLGGAVFLKQWVIFHFRGYYKKIRFLAETMNSLNNACVKAVRDASTPPSIKNNGNANFALRSFSRQRSETSVMFWILTQH